MNIDLNSVVLGGDETIKRLPNSREIVPDELMGCFDSRTIFYDVFVGSCGDRLLAIGPPLLNLKSLVREFHLTINGRSVRYRWRDFPDYKLSLLEADLSPADRWDVGMSGPGFDTSLVLEKPMQRSGRRVLAAISKNNRVRWISDWVDFYRERYALDDIVIYDNGSDNVGELKLAVDGRAHVIDWKFPFGPPDTRFNSFAQQGALNHCLRKFTSGGTLFNFDIDELLIADNSRLEKELERSGTLYFESHNVPFVRPSLPDDDYSYFDFKHRLAERRATARKFICLADRVDIISQHNTWRYRGFGPWRRLLRIKPERHTSRSAEFLHFLGITTNWQPRLNKLQEHMIDGLVFDDRHINMRPRKENTA